MTIFGAPLFDILFVRPTREGLPDAPPAPPVELVEITGDLTQPVEGVPYASGLSASGGTGIYTWSLASGSLPAGLALEPTTGLIYGTTYQEGEFIFTLRATDTASSYAEAVETIDLLNCAPYTRQPIAAMSTDLTVASSTVPIGSMNANLCSEIL